MFLAHCMMEWIVLTVLSLCLPVWSAVKVIQPYRVVSTNGTAQVQCFVQPQPSYHQIQVHYDQSLPSPGPEELRVTLVKGLHGTQALCSSIPNFIGEPETGVEKEGEVKCTAVMREGAVEVTVTGLKATDTDMYRCEIEIFYPPPFLRLTGNGTLIHVLESSDCPVQAAHRQTARQGDEEEDDDVDEMSNVSVPVGVLMFLVMFVLVIITAFQILQCERGKREVVIPVPGVLHKVDATGFSCENIA
ncbi:cytotoxic T-lymphocyte protein 4 [Chelmon rostratus]|uniref:cytotoxic T-lymphocyte protein 4 n=1 Tax=Chelmon rostratus TaxID=109905 RepID=UPI001BE7AD31|nr:cytotoxic T-lymphocyte protein 4 [Chelmon rostratus]